MSENKTGTFCWNELVTKDTAEATSFYGSLFGWEESTIPMPNGSTYHFLKRPGDENPSAGMMQITEEMGELPPHWMSFVMVESCDEASAKAESMGATIVHPSTDVGMGVFAIIKDPQGAVFSLWEPKES